MAAFRVEEYKAENQIPVREFATSVRQSATRLHVRMDFDKLESDMASLEVRPRVLCQCLRH